MGQRHSYRWRDQVWHIVIERREDWRNVKNYWATIWVALEQALWRESSLCSLEMNAPNWIFGLFPFFFPKRKKEIKAELERILRDRFEVVARRLHVEGVSKPRLKFLPGSKPFYLNGSVYLNYSIGAEKQFETIDHEITHHIQHSVNSHIKGAYSFEFFSFFYWGLTGKLKYGLANRSFQEGFATYVAYLTSGKLPKPVENGKTIVQKRKRLKMLFHAEAMPYVLGYLAYSTIAEKTSEEGVLQVGLSATVNDWVLRVESCGFHTWGENSH